MKPNLSIVTAITLFTRWCCMAFAAIAVCIPIAHAAERTSTFVADEQNDRIVITHSDQPVAEFVFRDEKILRPYCANVHVPGGQKATRNHPPIASLLQDFKRTGLLSQTLVVGLSEFGRMPISQGGTGRDHNPGARPSGSRARASDPAPSSARPIRSATMRWSRRITCATSMQPCCG